MEARIQQRIRALEQDEQATIMRLTVIANLLSELRALLAPDAPTLSGDARDPPHAHGKDVHTGPLV